ncbi:hypothetical protein ACPXB1_14370 [Micromonospora sp. DT68]|uniref:hypothetical protein n=1 Tax=Micromonospora TaxID=1873 RepID=UPI0033A138B0
MSDDSSNRASRRAERPHDVTDPLLWQLALDVLDAHEPTEDGVCGNLLCAGEPYPCAARGNAEQSLRLARGGAETPPTAAQQWDGHDETPDNWSTQESFHPRRTRSGEAVSASRASAA